MLLEEVNEKISFLCNNNNFIFVDNSNISSIHLFDDGLHLVESGRCILANNVIDQINNFFISTLSPPEQTHTHNGVINIISLRVVYRNNRQISDLQISCKLKLKYPRNPLIGYLNINSLKNIKMMFEN